MPHGITYADEAYSPETQGNMTLRYWYPVMRQGQIDFILPQDCPITRVSRPMSIKPFGQEQQNFTGHSEFIEEVL